MPTLGELDDEQRQAFAAVWGVVREILRDGGPRYAALLSDPLDVRVTGGHHVFAFPDGCLMGMSSPDRLNVLRADGALFVYDSTSGHCRFAQLGPALQLPIEELYGAWLERGRQARWC